LYYLPLPRQVELEEAIASRSYGAICIGGARGGSKSKAWRMIAQRYSRTLPNFTVLFLRRELEPLRLNHLRFIEQEAKLLGAKYVGMKMSWPDMDSEIKFNHCHETRDYRNFVGAEADLVVFEQLEQFETIQFDEIGAVAGRVERDDWRGLIGASENPNGPLSAFVDTLFVNKNPDAEKYPNYDPADYHFIYSHLEDNPYVSKQYVANLARMSPEKRAMYRYGRRDVFPGQFFPAFNATQHVQSAA
jgi:phage terminase large subunit